MFATITDALEAYKAERLRYWRWEREFREMVEQKKTTRMSAEEANWPLRIKVMQEALGLTADEIRVIDEELEARISN